MTSPWNVTPAKIGTNPDMAGLNSADPSCGAVIVTVKGPLPPVGSAMMLQINTPKTGGVDVTWTVQPVDSTTNVAGELAALINANETLAAANITAEYTPGSATFGITNLSDNLAVASAQSFPANFAIDVGSAAWDAGPLFYLDRVVPGTPPAPGSNVGQVIFGSSHTAAPDTPNTQYSTLSGNVLSSDVNDLHGELAVYTAETRNGTAGLGKRISVTDDGLGGGVLRLNDPDGADIPQGHWFPYTPSVRTGAGTLGAFTATGMYARVGKTVFFQARLSIQNNGNAGVCVILGLPLPGTGDDMVFPGRARSISGKMLQCMVGSPSEMVVVDYANGYPGQNGEVLAVGGFYPTKIG